MLDDFLIVSPRKAADTDEETLLRGRSEGALFDNLLAELKLPLAVEKVNRQPFLRFGVVWNTSAKPVNRARSGKNGKNFERISKQTCWIMRMA